MRVLRHRLALDTAAPIALVDITERVRGWVRATCAAAGVQDGLVTVTSGHTTARVTVNESEPKLQRDMVAFLERVAPAGAGYAHDTGTVDGRVNAHAHLLALLMPATETIPVVDGDLALGTWQSLFFVELDGPRAGREVLVQLLAARDGAPGARSIAAAAP